MNPLINIANIKRDFVLGTEIINVLKGIDLQIIIKILLEYF